MRSAVQDSTRTLIGLRIRFTTLLSSPRKFIIPNQSDEVGSTQPYRLWDSAFGQLEPLGASPPKWTHYRLMLIRDKSLSTPRTCRHIVLRTGLK